MKWQPGQPSPNPFGRPKGTTYSFKLKMIITNHLEENLSQYLDEVKALRPSMTKVNAILGLLQFSLPKLSQSDSTIDINSLTNAEAASLLDKIRNSEN